MPWIGAAIALATVAGTMRRKGFFRGALDTGLNAVPFLGAAKTPPRSSAAVTLSRIAPDQPQACPSRRRGPRFRARADGRGAPRVGDRDAPRELRMQRRQEGL